MGISDHDFIQERDEFDYFEPDHFENESEYDYPDEEDGHDYTNEDNEGNIFEKLIMRAKRMCKLHVRNKNIP